MLLPTLTSWCTWLMFPYANGLYSYIVFFVCFLNCNGGHYLLLEAEWPRIFNSRIEGPDTPMNFVLFIDIRITCYLSYIFRQ